MPIFQDEGGRERSTPPNSSTFTFPGPVHQNLKNKSSEESIRTDLCEGPLLDSPQENAQSRKDEAITGSSEALREVCDRIELIQRLKRGESPNWTPKQHVEAIISDLVATNRSREGSPVTRGHTPLLPPPDFRASSERDATSDVDTLQVGMSIQRPRSALHSGNFTEERGDSAKDFEAKSDVGDGSLLYGAQPQWLCTSPPRGYITHHRDDRLPSLQQPAISLTTRSRAPSLSSSYSSSFVFKPPTSPLVHSETHDDLSFSSVDAIDFDTSDFSRNPRRHTYHPHVATPSTAFGPFASGHASYSRRDKPHPYQAHQPRRSLTMQRSSSQAEHMPQTSVSPYSRRPSFTFESPGHHASMVGSYEESILRGRMSTNPSKPLDFVAQIGVLGLGKCKPSLKCPPHVSLSFPAVFYSYATTSHGRSGRSEEGPSPYVGQIDLENGLPHLSTEDRHDIRQRRCSKSRSKSSGQTETSDGAKPAEVDKRRAQKQKRRSTSPKAPPGGSYRIPERGQLQVILKNPNKTAVKLFLIPFDLAGMEPGTKTFIRQRSYSAGPIIDIPGAVNRPSQVTTDRILRYLIHLHICCPSRGRYYLYKTIRVVFANRVPDGKEKLENEIQFPEPRFTSYKPGRDSVAPSTTVSPSSERAFRRRSANFPFGSSQQPFQQSIEGISQALDTRTVGLSPYPYNHTFSTTPVEAIPFSLQRTYPTQAEESGKDSRPQTAADSMTSSSWNTNSSSSGIYDKLSKGDVGYGGNAFARSYNNQQIGPEGLLAQKLKSLGVGKLGQDAASEESS